MSKPSLVIVALLTDGDKCGKMAVADGKIDISSLIPSRCISDERAPNANCNSGYNVRTNAAESVYETCRSRLARS